MVIVIKETTIKRRGVKFRIKRRKDGTFAKGRWVKTRRKKRIGFQIGNTKTYIQKNVSNETQSILEKNDETDQIQD